MDRVHLPAPMLLEANLQLPVCTITQILLYNIVNAKTSNDTFLHCCERIQSDFLQPLPVVPCPYPCLHSDSYQLAFFTPGILPAKALTRKLYCREKRCQLRFNTASHPLVDSCHDIWTHTLVILKSLSTPRPLPPSIHRLRICVERV